MHRFRVSRRTLLAVSALAAWPLAREASASPAVPSELVRHLYRFDPIGAGPASSCRSCTACRNHAIHKRFATREAADRNRAHPYCRCAIRAVPVGHATFAALFPLGSDGAPVEHTDLRWLSPDVADGIAAGEVGWRSRFSG